MADQSESDSDLAKNSLEPQEKQSEISNTESDGSRDDILLVTLPDSEDKAEQSRSEPQTQETQESAPSKNSRKLPNVKILLASNLKLITACAASVFIGFLGSWLTRPSTVDEGEVAAKEVKPVYVAATTRRNEPILPLVPFAELDKNVIAIGKRLFHDSGLSGNGKVSCASCHDIAKGGDDGLVLPVGLEGAIGSINTPTVLNAALNVAQFWDGRAATLEEQLDGPINNPDEMGSSWDRVKRYVSNDERYRLAFEAQFGGAPTVERIKEAIVTYERSLVTVQSDLDRWLQGEEEALDSDEFGGYFLFKKMNCISCHQGPAVGGTTFQPLGKLKAYFTEENTPTEVDLGRFNVTGDEKDKYVFRVPSLRNVAMTGPYLHDGSAETLGAAVSIMIEHQVGMDPNDEDVRRIVAFLKTMNGKIPDSWHD